MTKERATHSQSTEFDGPIDAGDAHKNRNADKKKVGQMNADTAAAGKVSVFPSGKLAEELDTLLAGVEGLSEDFTEKTATLLEGAISEHIEVIRESMEAEYAVKLDEADALTEEKLDAYLNLVVEKYLEENRLAITKTIRDDISEQVIAAMVGIVEGAGVEIPEEKIDITESLIAENDELEASLNKVMEESIALTAEIRTLKEGIQFEALTEGMTVASKDKLRRLMENVSYADEAEYATKLNTLKESVTGVAAPEATDLNEAVDVPASAPVHNDRMSAYLSAARGE